MNLKSNFITGLTTGVALCLSFFLFISASQGTKAERQVEQSVIDPIKGGFISSENASGLISAYTTDWVQANSLPSNTTTGGSIGTADLSQVIGDGSSETIKFSYYYTTSGEGAPQIGLILYPADGSAQVYRTGPNSFCPTLCD